ncbi:type I glyceraldehyde-3-phosphate dehydrogenase [Candidatus Bathyarchaeota archaeon]|nr:type I glyceraldehyde-3-phosphate dehydrogenase [Candidatus Bathyarchaeota archaeon]
MVNAAINGFGRIGRLLYRAALEENADINFVAVNDLTDAKTLAHMLKNDTVHGKFPFEVKAQSSSLIVDGKELKIIAEPDPAKLPWKDMDVYVAVESTGRFRTRDAAGKHIAAGAKKVLVSAPMSPAASADLTVVYGVNDNLYDPNKHNIMSLASCTTNCLAPVAKVLNENFGIDKGLMTTVHAVTNDQRLLDMQHSDLRRARAAAFNMIPTSTGAASAVGLALPMLNGKLNGISLRVPIPDVSIVDLVAILKKEATVEEINTALKNAANGPLKGVLGYSEEPLVSSDLIHNNNSAIIDGQLTMTIGNLVKVFAWYDNEWGYSVKMARMIEKICKMA